MNEFINKSKDNSKEESNIEMYNNNYYSFHSLVRKGKGSSVSSMAFIRSPYYYKNVIIIMKKKKKKTKINSSNCKL